MDGELEITLAQSPNLPIFQQISDQVRRQIASGNLRPGDHLPTVRRLSAKLGVSPGTIVKAYLQLEQEGIVTARRGGGTIVARPVASTISSYRQQRLDAIIHQSTLELLSLGYTPEELETTFLLHLARWRSDQREKSENSGLSGSIDNRDTVFVAGSDDLAFFLLLGQMRRMKPELRIDVNKTGSLGGLIALQEGSADLAGIHLLDDETGEYNYPFIKHVLPGRDIVVVHLAYRIQGLIHRPGNPKGLNGLQDLARPDVTIVNRQQGSGTRILLDSHLARTRISPESISGYEREVQSHLDVAAAVSGGEADAGLGIEAAARSCKLGFLPLFKERFDLVMPLSSYRSRLVALLLDVLTGDDFRQMVSAAGGYDITEMGATTFLRPAG